jgi:hypothetical protein
MGGKKAEGTGRGDPRLALLDGVIRRLLYLASCLGISAEQLSARFKALGSSQLPPNARGARLEARTFNEVHAGPEVLQSWTRNLDFLDEAGKPRPLPRSGPGPSFTSLVGACAPGVDPETVLKDLLVAEAVSLTGDGRVEAILPSLVFRCAERRAELGLYSVENLLASVQMNVNMTPASEVFQREAVCLRFDRRQLPRAHRYLNQQCLGGLMQADDWLNTYTVGTDARVQDAVTVVVGTYVTIRD